MAPVAAGKLAALVQRRIRELRLAQELTQQELCERAGISVDAITRIESGKRVPELATIEAIANALGVSVFSLFEGHTPPPKYVIPPPMRRMMTLLERQPSEFLTLAEGVVNGLVKASRQRDGDEVPHAAPSPSRHSDRRYKQAAKPRKRG